MNEELPAADPGEWFVAFYSADIRQWWEFGDPPGFGHCLAFAYSAHAACWVTYDVTRHRTFVRALKPDVFTTWLQSLGLDLTVVRITTRPVEARFQWRLGFWCTVAVKHLLGVPSRALRPRALCRDLLASGAAYAFGTGPRDEDQGCRGSGSDGSGGASRCGGDGG